MLQYRLSAAAFLIGAGVFTTAAMLQPRKRQAIPPSTLTATTPVNLTGPPETVLYRLLFRAALALDQAAKQREAAGQDATPLREFFVHHANLSQGESDIVFQAAADEAAAEASDNAAAQKLISGWQAQAKVHTSASGPLPSPPLAELRQLEADRDNIAMREREQMHLLLGDDGFNRLEVFIHGHYGRARNLTLPQPGRPGAGSQAPTAGGGPGGSQ